jgi:hypothetical protein
MIPRAGSSTGSDRKETRAIRRTTMPRVESLLLEYPSRRDAGRSLGHGHHTASSAMVNTIVASPTSHAISPSHWRPVLASCRAHGTRLLPPALTAAEGTQDQAPPRGPVPPHRGGAAPPALARQTKRAPSGRDCSCIAPPLTTIAGQCGWEWYVTSGVQHRER